MQASQEYSYTDSLPTCSHEYLLPPLLRFLAAAPAGARVLDLGCGNGSMLAHLHGHGWDLTGIDASSSGIDQARQAFPAVRFMVADVSNRLDPLCPPGSFDFIYSTEVIEHLYNPRGLLRNCFQLLRPGGRLLLSTPYHGYLKNLVIALAGGFDRHVSVLWDHGHIKFWSRNTLTTALVEAGFADLQFIGTGRVPYLWKSMVMAATRPAPGASSNQVGHPRIVRLQACLFGVAKRRHKVASGAAQRSLGSLSAS